MQVNPGELNKRIEIYCIWCTLLPSFFDDRVLRCLRIHIFAVTKATHCIAPSGTPILFSTTFTMHDKKRITDPIFVFPHKSP